jgi:hypothetical protein
MGRSIMPNKIYFRAVWGAIKITLSDLPRLRVSYQHGNKIYSSIAETSGGLLIALPHEQAIKLIENLQAHGQTAVIVGHVTGSGGGELFFR